MISLSEDQQKTTGTEETIEEQSDPLQTKYEAMSQDQKQLLEDLRKSMETKRHDPDSQAVR